MINNKELSADGLQSRLDFRFDLVDPMAVFRLANILDYGSKRYGENNWRKISKREHINRVISHCYAELAKMDGNLPEEDDDDHIGHAFCRAMFAVALSGTETPVAHQYRLSNTKTRFHWSGQADPWTCASCRISFSGGIGLYTNDLIKICVNCFEAL